MTTLAHFDTPISEPINAQIMQLVVDHLSDISAMEIAPSNLLYSIYQYAIGFEVHLYLQALDGSKGIAVELIVATDEQAPEKVTGFVLYLPYKDDPQACGVAYMMLRQKGEQERIYQILCDTITNSIETLGGMVCDGAKASCAAKIGLAVENALMALELSLAGNVFQPGEGMTMEDPEDTIAAVGRMGRVGMKSTDVEILNIMLGN